MSTLIPALLALSMVSMSAPSAPAALPAPPMPKDDSSNGVSTELLSRLTTGVNVTRWFCYLGPGDQKAHFADYLSGCRLSEPLSGLGSILCGFASRPT